jgi:hypothetical protein
MKSNLFYLADVARDKFFLEQALTVFFIFSCHADFSDWSCTTMWPSTSKEPGRSEFKFPSLFMPNKEIRHVITNTRKHVALGVAKRVAAFATLHFPFVSDYEASA